MITIDYKYITSLIPDKMRRVLARQDYLYAETKGLESGAANFELDQIESMFIASHTGQVLSLLHLLNTLLTPLNPITIIDGSWYRINPVYFTGELFKTQLYLYNKAEAQPDTYFYNKSEYNDDQIDFVINIAIADAALEKDVIYYTNLFVQGGKTYQVVQY